MNSKTGALEGVGGGHGVLYASSGLSTLTVSTLKSLVHRLSQRICTIINPRRECAAGVTVVVLSVCLSARVLALQATRRPMSGTNGL